MSEQKSRYMMTSPTMDKSIKSLNISQSNTSTVMLTKSNSKYSCNSVRKSAKLRNSVKSNVFSKYTKQNMQLNTTLNTVRLSNNFFTN